MVKGDILNSDKSDELYREFLKECGIYSYEKVKNAMKMFLDVAMQMDFSKKHDALQTKPDADEAKPIEP